VVNLAEVNNLADTVEIPLQQDIRVDQPLLGDTNLAHRQRDTPLRGQAQPQGQAVQAQQVPLRPGPAKRAALHQPGPHPRGLQQELVSRQHGRVQVSIQAGRVLVEPGQARHLRRDHDPHLPGQGAEAEATHPATR